MESRICSGKVMRSVVPSYRCAASTRNQFTNNASAITRYASSSRIGEYAPRISSTSMADVYAKQAISCISQERGVPAGGNGRSKSASIMSDEARVSTAGLIAGINQLSGPKNKCQWPDRRGERQQDDAPARLAAVGHILAVLGGAVGARRVVFVMELEGEFRYQQRDSAYHVPYHREPAQVTLGMHQLVDKQHRAVEREGRHHDAGRGRERE